MNKNTRVSMALIIILIITVSVVTGCEQDQYRVMLEKHEDLIRPVEEAFMELVLSEYDAFADVIIRMSQDMEFELYISEGETVDEDAEKELLSRVEEFVSDNELFESAWNELKPDEDFDSIRVIFVEYNERENAAENPPESFQYPTVHTVYIRYAPEWNEWLCIYPDATQLVEQ